MNNNSTIRCLTAGLLTCLVASFAAAQQPAKTDLYGDPLPPGAVARLGTSRLVAGSIGKGGLTFTSDGKKLIATISMSPLEQASIRPLAQVWDVQSGKLIYAAPRPQKDASKSTISPDCKLLAVNGPEGLSLQDIDSGKKLFQLTDPSTGPTNYAPVSFTPDSSKLVMAIAQENVFWDTKTGKKLFSIPLNYGLTFTPDGKRMADIQRTEQGMEVHIYDAENGKPIKTLQPGKTVTWIMQMAFAGDGVTVALCQYGPPREGDKAETLWLWNTDTGEKIKGFVGMSRGADSIAISADAKILAASDIRGTIRIINTSTGEVMHDISTLTTISQIALSPDGATLAAAGGIDGAIRLWDTKTGKQFFTDRGHQTSIDAVAIRPDARQVATGSRDGTVRIWNIADGKQILALDMTAVKPDLTPSTASAPTSASSPASAPATASAPAYEMPDRPATVLAVAFSPDGTTLAASTLTQIIVWRLPAGELIATLPGGATKLKFSPDGKNIISTGQDDSTTLWDIAQQKLLQTTPKAGLYEPPLGEARVMLMRDRCNEPTGQFSACVWSLWPIGYQPKPGLYATVVENLTLQPVIAELVIEPMRSMAAWGTAAFSPDARRLATAGCDGPILAIWDLPTAQKICDLDGHTGVILGLAFSANGKLLASAGVDGTALIWDVDAVTKRPVSTAPVSQPVDWYSIVSDLGSGNGKVSAEGRARGRQQLISDLAGEDAPKAYAAMWVLVDLQDKATDFLATKLSPVTKVDAAAVKQIVTDLDSETFAVRKKAADDLNKLGPAAIPAMKEALKNATSTEVKTAIEAFLAKQEQPVNSRFEVRSVYILERIGTDKAKQLLKSLAAGTPDATITKQAQAALERLNRTNK